MTAEVFSGSAVAAVVTVVTTTAEDIPLGYLQWWWLNTSVTTILDECVWFPRGLFS